MINQNIKHFRKTKGLSQEEMAVKLNVVRQTVSKWENGLSVPDADVLIQMAEVLGVSVSQLLGVEAENISVADLSEELAKLNEQLAKKIQREKLQRQAGRIRGLILGISFLAMLLALLIENAIASVTLVGVSMAVTAIILFRNLALLTSITTDDLRTGILHVTTLFNIGVLIAGVIFTLLIALDIITFSENGERMLAMALVSCVMIFVGIVSPKLPYSKHTGLRLPWTVQDEDTWNIAHRTIGHISIPIVLLYITCTWTVPNFEIVTLCAMLLWIGIPAVISFAFFQKKYHS